MSNAFVEISREARKLSLDERHALARLLLEMDRPVSTAAIEATWEAEILARVQAVEEGRVAGIPFDQVLARVDRRLAQ